jgi:hypothetical protein
MGGVARKRVTYLTNVVICAGRSTGAPAPALNGHSCTAEARSGPAAEKALACHPVAHGPFEGRLAPGHCRRLGVRLPHATKMRAAPSARRAPAVAANAGTRAVARPALALPRFSPTTAARQTRPAPCHPASAAWPRPARRGRRSQSRPAQQPAAPGSCAAGSTDPAARARWPRRMIWSGLVWRASSHASAAGAAASAAGKQGAGSRACTSRSSRLSPPPPHTHTCTTCVHCPPNNTPKARRPGAQTKTP